MDIRGFEGARSDTGNDPTEGGVGEATIDIGTDERRMHVRAYNHWVSLLKGRHYPSVSDLDPSAAADFSAHGVLLDFTSGIDDPTITYLGAALRDECALDRNITRISEVPPRSLLSRLTHHYLQIIANQAPIGFEAEFVSTRGHNTMYRGILTPFSSDGATIDFIYGVINWKELVGIVEQAKLDAELLAAVRSVPKSATPAPAPAPVWADGPSAAGGAGFEAEADLIEASSGSALRAHDALLDRAPIASITLNVAADAGELVVLLGRTGEGGVIDVLGAIDDPALVAQAATALR